MIKKSSHLRMKFDLNVLFLLVSAPGAESGWKEVKNELVKPSARPSGLTAEESEAEGRRPERQTAARF